MRIGILGAGNIGATLARLFTAADHEVAIANSRGPKTLSDLVAEVEGLTAADADAVAAWAEVVVEAIPFGRYGELPADALAGKVVLSAANHYPDRDGDIELGDRVDTELVAEHLADSRVVKAFNAIWFKHLATQGDTDLPIAQRRAVFLAGDDAEAKELAARLVADIGFGPVDTGSLHDGGRRQQVGSDVYNEELTVAEARAQLGADPA